MINALNLKDLGNLQEEGLKALSEKLGPIGMVNFIRLFDNGKGDYSKERRENLNSITEVDFKDFLKNQ
ncbi:MAG TPA: hypothetical protein PK733_05690 [Clostridiales bacterium]|nr:hypothetical protein [Clostridiales bacterium]